MRRLFLIPALVAAALVYAAFDEAAGVRTWLRLRGDLVPIDHPVLTSKSNREILFEILSPEQQRHVEKKRDFDMAYELENVGRFRCNFFYQHRGIGAVFRIIPTKIMTLEQLNLPEAIKTIANFKKGLVLVSSVLLQKHHQLYHQYR